MAQHIPGFDAVAQLFAGALEAVARVDGEITPEESSRMRDLVGQRTSAEIDYEAMFFEKVTPEKLAAGTGAVDRRAVGRAFVADAVVLATADGDLNGPEAQAILRFARALGCTREDVAAETRELDEWLSSL